MGPRPYIDAGVGTYYISNAVDVGLVAINETNWHLGFAPDAGIVQPLGGDTAAFVNARFNYVKAENITYSYWGSESAWPGSPTETSRMQIADCTMESDKAANAAICFLRSVINTLHAPLCLAANPHQALGQETKSSLAVAVAGGALGLYSGASRLPSHRSFLTVRRLFEASHAVLVSLFAVGCMPTYETSPTPHASRACPTRDSGTPVGSVNWYFPVADDDNRELERWCRTVGPPVIDSMPNGEFGTLDERDSLAIAVWNTDAGAGDLLAFITTELQLECSGTSSRLSHGSSHFVLLLQEALRRSNDIPPEPPQWVIPPPVKEDPRPTPRLDVVEVAQQCGLALVYFAGARNGHAERDGKREDKGEAILSTLPLSDFIAVELPYEAARRVAVAATIHNRSGDSLRVSSVHLISTPPPWRVLTTANTSRLRQALALVDVHRQAELDRADAAGPGLRACYPNCTADGSVGFTISSVIAGDLNTWSNRETTLQHLFEHFPHSPPVLGEPTRGPFPTDHILFRHSAQRLTHPDQIIASTYRRIDDPYYSDHHPIIAWFRFGT